jgi:hypothetical protein
VLVANIPDLLKWLLQMIARSNTLADFNRTIGAGVAAISEAGLPDTQRLQVPNNPTLNCHVAGIMTAAATIAHLGSSYHSKTDANVTAAYAVVRTGLVYTKFVYNDTRGLNGSDFVLIEPNSITQEQVKIVKKLIDLNKVSRVVTLALATKYNFWVTNHHVGRGGGPLMCSRS